MPKSLKKSNHYISPRLIKNSEKPKDRIALHDKVPKLPNITKWVVEEIKIKSDSCEIFLKLYKPYATSYFHKFPKQESNWSVEGRKTCFESRESELIVRAAHWASTATVFLHVRDAHRAHCAMEMRAAHRAPRLENNISSPRIRAKSPHFPASKLFMPAQ